MSKEAFSILANSMDSKSESVRDLLLAMGKTKDVDISKETMIIASCIYNPSYLNILMPDQSNRTRFLNLCRDISNEYRRQLEANASQRNVIAVWDYIDNY